MNNQPYIRPIPKSWWLQEKRYIRYMARELSCLFIVIHASVLLLGLYRLSQGQAAFEAFLSNLSSPPGLVLSSSVLLMAVVHSFTWFNLTPKAMPIWIGDKPLSATIIIGAHYAVWFVVSLVTLLLAGGGF